MPPLPEQFFTAQHLGDCLARPDFTHQRAVGAMGIAFGRFGLETQDLPAVWTDFEVHNQDDLTLNNPNDSFFQGAFRISVLAAVNRKPDMNEVAIDFGTACVLRGLVLGVAQPWRSALKGEMVKAVRDILSGSMAQLEGAGSTHSVYEVVRLQAIMSQGNFGNWRTVLHQAARTVQSKREYGRNVYAVTPKARELI